MTPTDQTHPANDQHAALGLSASPCWAPSYVDELRESLDRQHGVIKTVNDLKGWHLVEAELRKPGVYRIITSRRRGAGAELRHGFASQQIITTARELGYLSAPNGFTLPNDKLSEPVSTRENPNP